MAKLDTYTNKYSTVKLVREEDGILLMTFHTDGGALRWSAVAHREFSEVFHDIANDPENKVVIMTGAGDEFTGPRPPSGPKYSRPAAVWDRTFFEGRNLLMNLLSIEVPMISVVNGPALRHSELPLLCDIVIATENACFEDSGHFQGGLVPGDGVNVVYPLLLGLNRARYFLFTGQSIDAQKALELGLVNEVLPKGAAMERAMELARNLAEFPDMHRKYTRLILTEALKRSLQEHLGYSLMLEAAANMALPEAPKT